MIARLRAEWQRFSARCPMGFGFGEVLTVAVLYIFGVRLFLAATPVLRPYAGVLEGAEEQIATSFTKGVVFQLAFVALMVVVFRSAHTRSAIQSLRQGAPRIGWILAGLVVVLEVAVVSAGWIADPSRLLELTGFSIAMALIPALDGVTQEVVFRGYLLRRLDAAGFSRWLQVVFSGLAFGALHFNYGGAGETLLEQLIPAFGTFALGAALAIVCQASRYRLLPVAVAHVLIIVALQPWLALSSMP